MMNKSVLLLKTLLLSTSQRNIFRHSGDKKKRKRIIGNLIGSVILYAMLMAYCIAMCFGYGAYGIIDAAPAMCALVISVLGFFLTLFRTNGYLFAFKEYDMLISLPFEAHTVAACKFLYMYIKSLPWHLSVSVAMLVGYGVYARPSLAVYPVWLVLTFLLPLIPMLAAAFIGFLVARVSAGFKKKNIIQTVLTIAFVLLIMALRFVIEHIFRENKVEQTLNSVSDVTAKAGRVYLPVGWFSGAVTRLSVPDMLLLAGVSVVLFGAVFYIVGKSYRNINSALKSHAAAKRYRLTGQKTKSVVGAIAFKEFKRLTGSTVYMVNGAMGEILAALLGVIALIFGFDKIVATVTGNAPFDYAIIHPAIPFIVYFFIGMMATTACSPSLEGKNYWIIQSLPLEKKTIYQGKMLFNMYLTVPFALFSTLCLCVSAKVPPADTVLYVILAVCLCAFSTARGCVCGIRHMRLDWENEVEIVKQSTAVTVYLLPNMFVCMALCALAGFLGTKMSHALLALIFIGVVGLAAAWSYHTAIKLAKKA